MRSERSWIGGRQVGRDLIVNGHHSIAMKRGMGLWRKNGEGHPHMMNQILKRHSGGDGGKNLHSWSERPSELLS